MSLELKFGQDDVVRFFERSTASEVYRSFYGFFHGFIPAPELGVDLEYLNGSLRVGLSRLLEDRCGSHDYSIFRKEFNERAVGSPQYDSLERELREKIGKEAEPYFKEYRLLSELRRTFDTLLMMVHSASTENCPEEISGKIHADTIGRIPGSVYRSDFVSFINWLEAHPESNNYQMNDRIRSLAVKATERLKAINNFYRETNPKPIIVGDGWDVREGMIKFFNQVFHPDGPKRKMSKDAGEIVYLD